MKDVTEKAKNSSENVLRWKTASDVPGKINNKNPLSSYLGTWKGDDIDKMLDLVYKTRSKF